MNRILVSSMITYINLVFLNYLIVAIDMPGINESAVINDLNILPFSFTNNKSEAREKLNPTDEVSIPRPIQMR